MHNSSTSSGPLPPLTDAVRYRSSAPRALERTKTFERTGLLPYTGSPMQAKYQQQLANYPPADLNRASTNTRLFQNADNTNYNLLTNPIVNTSTSNNHNYENYKPPYTISSALNQRKPRDRQPFLPVSLPPSSEDLYSMQQQQNKQSQFNNSNIEEPAVIPTLCDDDGLPVVSMDKTHLPVYARFPFDVTFIPQPMDTNVEDNIHKLRLRLIDSELNYQRRSNDEYIKRTQKRLSLSSPKVTEHYLQNIRSSNHLIYQRETSQILSRQTTYSPLSIEPPMTVGYFSGSMRGQIGMENDPKGNLDIERELEMRRTQGSLNSGRRSNQQLMISNYVYDPRLHLQPVNEEEQYSSSNMDDLIDSMARRHLSSRRLDVAIDHQRRGNSGYRSYYDSSALGRRPSLRSQQRNDDLFFTNTASAGRVEHDFLRTNSNDFHQRLQSRVEYYNRIQPDLDSFGMSNVIRTNSYSKLPPISPGYDSNHLHRSQNPASSTLYQARHHRSLPLNLPDHTEHLIELPSDIFLTRRIDPMDSTPPRHRSRKMRRRPISKNKKFHGSADSETDQSDDENNSSAVPRQQSRQKSKQEKHPDNGHHGFFTEGNPEQQKKPKHDRRLFKKAARGIWFIVFLKHRAAKSQLNRPRQTLSATIHKIRIQEILVALHRVYLEPEGPIYNALIQAINSPVELKDVFDKSSKSYSQATKVLGEALKDVFSRIVDFMPRDGVLGTAKTSAVAALIQDGNPFPDNYFWQCEKDLLEFHNSKIINITKQRAILLLVGIFIFRALITTLLMKPIKYRLMLGQLTPTQTASLKVLASVMFFVGRRAAKSIPQILTLPHEWELSLYSDKDLEPVIENPEIKSIITKCELSLRVWCEEYISRIDGSFGKELRT